MATWICSSAQLADAGRYTVAIFNQDGEVDSAPAVVIVLPSPKLKIGQDPTQPVIQQLVSIGNGQIGFLYYGQVGRAKTWHR